MTIVEDAVFGTMFVKSLELCFKVNPKLVLLLDKESWEKLRKIGEPTVQRLLDSNIKGDM